jgi:hypothetical protein
MFTEQLAKYKKAIGGAITAAVTFIIVKKLGGSEELAVAISTPLTGLAVAALSNVVYDIDEAISTSAIFKTRV